MALQAVQVNVCSGCVCVFCVCMCVLCEALKSVDVVLLL